MKEAPHFPDLAVEEREDWRGSDNLPKSKPRMLFFLGTDLTVILFNIPFCLLTPFPHFICHIHIQNTAFVWISTN